MTIYNREDPRTVLPQLEKMIKAFPQFDYGIEALPSVVAAGTYTDITVSFATNFTVAPEVVVGLRSTSTGSGIGCVSVAAFGISKTGFTIRVFNGDVSSRQPSISWIAIAKET